MVLKVIGTGSKGNAYLLENEQEALLIECGVNIRDIKAALNFNVKKLVGCIVTHEHKDHSKSMADVFQLGVDVYATEGTFGGLQSNRAKIIKANGQYSLGEGFKIKAFDVRHDAAEPVGFLINHPETGNILFLTDTFYCPYTFRNLQNIIIEANFSKAILKEKLTKMQFLKDRIFQSHMSLETCIDFLKANDLSQVNNIVLIHLSDGNSNEKLFREEVSKATGKTVTVADNGLEIELNKTPF